jgi:ABC-2 type transport system ATP-binding protein
MDSILTIRGLTKTYRGGHTALDNLSLSVRRGEIFALLGPNGAGKTTLIGITCGLVNPGSGEITVDGFDLVRETRQVRSRIGLVPQELATDTFERVIDTVRFSRGLFGLPADEAIVERVLRSLSLWDKRSAKIATLSGGMKRRVLIAKALVHDPALLFLDEPSAGVDVELRRDMWNVVCGLRDQGVTIILTTHYIEEAEAIADRIGVMDRGKLLLVEETATLKRRLGQRQASVQLAQPLTALPPALQRPGLSLSPDGRELVLVFGGEQEVAALPALLEALAREGLAWHDLATRESSLEEIFVSLVRSNA